MMSWENLPAIAQALIDGGATRTLPQPSFNGAPGLTNKPSRVLSRASPTVRNGRD